MSVEDKITKDTYGYMYDSVKKTKDSGVEHGFKLCKSNGDIYAKEESICKGNECEIELTDKCNEPMGFPRQGNYHTHPYHKEVMSNISHLGNEYDIYDLLEGEGIYAVGNNTFIIPSGLNKNEFIETYLKGVLNTSFYKKAQPSYGDLVLEMVKAYNKETEGTVCISADTNFDYLSCYTANKYMLKKPMLRKSIDGFETNKDLDAPKWMIDVFNKENISLFNKLKSKK